MITDVTSKVNLPASAIRRSQTDAYPRNERGDQDVHSSDVGFVSPAHRAEIEQAVGKVREVLQQSNSRLRIEVDPDLHRVIVKILNGDSGEVIRQIPPQEVLELARNVSPHKGLLFEEHV